LALFRRHQIATTKTKARKIYIDYDANEAHSKK